MPKKQVVVTVFFTVDLQHTAEQWAGYVKEILEKATVDYNGKAIIIAAKEQTP